MKNMISIIYIDQLNIPKATKGEIFIKIEKKYLEYKNMENLNDIRGIWHSSGCQFEKY